MDTMDTLGITPKTMKPENSEQQTSLPVARFPESTGSAMPSDQKCSSASRRRSGLTPRATWVGVRPVERQLMRPWLMKMIDSGKVAGVEWMDAGKTRFKIPWKHGSRQGWNYDNDACLFMHWAQHTGRYRKDEPPNPKRWKANFRCAINSLPDVREVKNASQTRGQNAFRVYEFLTERRTRHYTTRRIGHSKIKEEIKTEFSQSSPISQGQSPTEVKPPMPFKGFHCNASLSSSCTTGTTSSTTAFSTTATTLPSSCLTSQSKEEPLDEQQTSSCSSYTSSCPSSPASVCSSSGSCSRDSFSSSMSNSSSATNHLSATSLNIPSSHCLPTTSLSTSSPATHRMPATCLPPNSAPAEWRRHSSGGSTYLNSPEPKWTPQTSVSESTIAFTDGSSQQAPNSASPVHSTSFTTSPGQTSFPMVALTSQGASFPPLTSNLPALTIDLAVTSQLDYDSGIGSPCSPGSSASYSDMDYSHPDDLSDSRSDISVELSQSNIQEVIREYLLQDSQVDITSDLNRTTQGSSRSFQTSPQQSEPEQSTVQQTQQNYLYQTPQSQQGHVFSSVQSQQHHIYSARPTEQEDRPYFPLTEYGFVDAVRNALTGMNPEEMENLDPDDVESMLEPESWMDIDFKIVLKNNTNDPSSVTMDASVTPHIHRT